MTTLSKTIYRVTVAELEAMNLEIKSKVAPAIPGSDHWKQLTWAIGAWRQASLASGQCMGTCENAARELEIERDRGHIVHINRRTG